MRKHIILLAVIFSALYSCTKESNDKDGIYDTIKIGAQTWFAENLRETEFQNGEKLNNIIDNEKWNNTSAPAFSYFDNNPNNEVLYNWYAVENNNICPEGFRVPTREDFEILFNEVRNNDSYFELYDRLILGGSSGFNANEFFYRGGAGNNGTFLKSEQSQYWTSSFRNSSSGKTEYFALMSSGNVQVNTYNLNVQNYGFCVRCIKN